MMVPIVNRAWDCSNSMRLRDVDAVRRRGPSGWRAGGPEGGDGSVDAQDEPARPAGVDTAARPVLHFGQATARSRRQVEQRVARG